MRNVATDIENEIVTSVFVLDTVDKLLTFGAALVSDDTEFVPIDPANVLDFRVRIDDDLEEGEQFVAFGYLMTYYEFFLGDIAVLHTSGEWTTVLHVSDPAELWQYAGVIGAELTEALVAAAEGEDA